jgi:hypothetical protein
MTWGLNTFGELGNGTTTPSDAPVEVKGLKGVTAIAAALSGQSTALLKDGTVMDWGANENGELGDGTTEESDVPVQVKGLSGVVGLPSGGGSMALLGNGTVMDWGFNASGQLGIGTNSGPELCKGPCSRVPVAVSNLRGVTAISAGLEHRLALLSNGTVMTWGPRFGQLPPPQTDSPVEVGGPSGITTIGTGQGQSFAASTPPPPLVTDVEPRGGPAAGGTSVTITGTDFTGATAVRFGAASAASFTVSSATSISAVPPAGTGSVDVTVTTPGGTSAATPYDRFRFERP